MLTRFDKDRNEILLNNHLDITVEVHGGITGDRIKIVGFEIEPRSIDWDGNPCNETKWGEGDINPKIWKIQDTSGPEGAKYDIYYTYSIRTVNSTDLWANRFDHYLKAGNDKVHHFQIFIAVFVAVILASLVWFCMNRVIEKDMDKVRRNNDKLKKARD